MLNKIKSIISKKIEDKKESSKADTYAVAKDETSNSSGSSSDKDWLFKIFNILYPHK